LAIGEDEGAVVAIVSRGERRGCRRGAVVCSRFSTRSTPFNALADTSGTKPVPRRRKGHVGVPLASRLPPPLLRPVSELIHRAKGRRRACTWVTARASDQRRPTKGRLPAGPPGPRTRASSTACPLSPRPATQGPDLVLAGRGRRLAADGRTGPGPTGREPRRPSHREAAPSLGEAP